MLLTVFYAVSDSLSQGTAEEVIESTPAVQVVTNADVSLSNCSMLWLCYVELSVSRSLVYISDSAREQDEATAEISNAASMEVGKNTETGK